MNKILMPYVNSSGGDIIRDTLCPSKWFRAYVMPHCEDSGRPSGKWMIAANDFANKRVPTNYPFFFNSKEEAMTAFDAILIAEGFTLINSEEEALKYRLLM